MKQVTVISGFRRILLSLIVWGLMMGQGMGQERLGLVQSNYSGVHGLLLNPASNIGSPLRWDINIVSAGIFAENNYAYFHKTSLWGIIRNSDDIGRLNASIDAETQGTVQTAKLQYDLLSTKLRKQAYVNTFVMGPSFMIRFKDHSFGLYWGHRSAISANRVPATLGFYEVDALQVGDVIDVKKFRSAGMQWGELALNYATNVISDRRHQLNIGGTVKLLQGYDAFYFDNKEHTAITIQDSFMTYDKADVRYGVANNVAGYGNANNGYQFSPKGYGLAIDIGAVFKLRSNNNIDDYTWKFGLSLMDFGKISFSKGASQHSIRSDDPFDFIQGEYAGVEEFDNVYELLSSQALSDSGLSYHDAKFGIWMPGGITAFAEYAIMEHLYVNAMVVRRLRFAAPAVERDNIWSVTPRYEKRWFEVSIPVVLYNDVDPRIGLAFRVGPLVIGSDNLPSLIRQNKWTGTDLYFALKINPATLNKDDKATANRGSSKKGVQGCFDF